MKKLSIKLRVTLWYTMFMAILVAIIISIFLSISSKVMKETAKNHLISKVEDTIKNIHIKDGKISENEHAELFEDGVYIMIYDYNKKLFDGLIPSRFDVATPLKSRSIREFQINGKKWIVYDYKIDYKKQNDVWVRGVVSMSSSLETIHSMVYISIIALPFLVILIAIGGYFITRRAFKPVSEINQTVNEINEGRDLSRRINLGSGKDEIYDLALTFDNMLDRLQDSFEKEKQFTSDASHELRTPTTVIISQCEYALEKAENVDDMRMVMEVILKQARKMSILISQLFTLARTDKGLDKLNIEIVDLSELAEIVVEEFSIMAEEKNISIKTEIEPNILFHADQTLITRMLMNLISNAIYYGKKDGFVLLEIRKVENKIIGHITDNGIGISETDLPHIWDRFYQVNKSRTSVAEGNMGLGLSMVKWIVESHGGSVEVQSRLAEGSKFTFVFTV